MSNIDGVIDNERKKDIFLAAKITVDKLTESMARSAGNITKMTELSLQVNERAISLSEKWMLFDGATIILSLSLLGSLLSRIGHVPRHSFEWLVCPAWFLLLISMYCCWVRMTSIHNYNSSILRTMDADVGKIGLQILQLSVSYLAAEIKSVTDVPAISHNTVAAVQTILDHSSQLTSDIAKMEQHATTARQEAMKRWGASTPFEHTAKLTTAVALILLCTFCITTILSL